MVPQTETVSDDKPPGFVDWDDIDDDDDEKYPKFSREEYKPR